jgi:hypothetical protein
MKINLTGDAPFSLASMGVCFDPITGTLAAISAFASANAGTIGAVSALAGLAGTGITAAGTLAAGDAAKASADSQALQLNQQATQARAASQRTMMEHQRQTGLVQSQLQARAAASGGGATDDTVLDLGGDVQARGEEQALMDLYNGENQGRGLEDQAKAKVASGEAAQEGASYSALGTIASGIGTGFSRFAGEGYKPRNSTG